MYNVTDKKRVPMTKESTLDISWWHSYVRRFNGVKLDDPMDLTLEQILDTSANVNCGNAQP